MSNNGFIGLGVMGSAIASHILKSDSNLIVYNRTPPAMFVCINKEASLHGIIKKKQDFCINVLSNKQQELSEVCSNSDEGESRFRDDGWRDEGTLIYNINSLSNIFCSCTAIIDYSTHSVFLGEVVNVKNNSQEKALLYASGGYIID